MWVVWSKQILYGVINETSLVKTPFTALCWEAIQNHFAVPLFAEAGHVTAN